MAAIRTFLRNESGATSIEYGLIAAFICLAIITVVSALGTELASTFESVEKGLAKRVAV